MGIDLASSKTDLTQNFQKFNLQGTVLSEKKVFNNFPPDVWAKICDLQNKCAKR